MHNLAEGDGTVVPVHLAVTVQVLLGNGDLDDGQLGGLVGVVAGGGLAGGVTGLVVPHGTGQADGVGTVDALNTLVTLALGVGMDTGGELAVGQEGVQIAVLVGGDEALGEGDVGISLGGGGGGHLGTGEDGVLLGGVNGQDVQMGDVDGGDAGAALGLLDLGDLPGQVVALDGDGNGHGKINTGIFVLHQQIVGLGIGIELDTPDHGLDGGAVDDDLVQIRLVAAEECLAGCIGLHDIAGDQGELLAHIDGHGVGLDDIILGKIQVGLGGDDGIEGVHLHVLNGDGGGVGLVAGLGYGECVLAHLDALEGVAAVLVGLGGVGADADGGACDQVALGVLDGTGDGSHGGLDDLHGLTVAVGAEAPVVAHAVDAVIGEIGELDVGVGGLGHDTELTQVAIGGGEALGHVLQGLVGGIGGGAVDGNGQSLIAQGDGDAQLLASHGIGQAGDLRIALGAIPAVLVVPLAGAVIANVQPVAVIDVAIEDTPVVVGLQGEGDGTSAHHVSVAVQIKDGTGTCVAVVVTTTTVGTAIDGEPFSAACCLDSDPACTAQDHNHSKNQAQNAIDFLHVFSSFLIFVHMHMPHIRLFILSSIVLQINPRTSYFLLYLQYTARPNDAADSIYII